MLLASFISGSLLTALISFIGYKFSQNSKPLERQKAIIQKNLIRHKALELVSASNNADDNEKALTIYSIEQLSKQQQDSFSNFADEVEKFHQVEVPETINQLRGYHSETCDMEPYIKEIETLSQNFKDSAVLDMNHLDKVQQMISFPMQYIPYEQLRNIKDGALKHKNFRKEQATREKAENAYKKSLEDEKLKASQIYDDLVAKYDPYYYVTATNLRLELNRQSTPENFEKFVKEIVRLSNLNSEIIEVITKAKLMVEKEPGFNLLDQNTVHGWIAEVANKDYMSTRNPFMEFNEDWKLFDSRRKALARERNKSEIWNLKKLSATNESNHRSSD